MDDIDLDLWPVIAAIRRRDMGTFLAAQLDGPRELAAAAWLGLSLRQLATLELCRAPRCAADVAAIAEHVGTDAGLLADVLGVLTGYDGQAGLPAVLTATGPAGAALATTMAGAPGGGSGDRSLGTCG